MSQAAEASEAAARSAAPSRMAVAWAIGLLSLVSFFNYMDRMVLAVLLEPIKHELGLSDSQLGLLSGLAFAALYATLGLPLARLADRASRTKLLAVCLGLWTVMTAATGMARGFPTLFLARMGVGIGEAGCVPAAHSLIGDYLPPARRALGISIFQAGGLAGLSVGLVATGWLADHFGWRAALTVVGLSGAPLGLLILATLREPPRRGLVARSAEPGLSAVRALLGRPALFHLVMALSVGGFGAYGIAQWLAAFFIRVHGLSLTQIGFWSGLSSGLGGILGVMAGGALAVRLIPKDARWELWLPAIAYGGAAPLYAIVFLSPSPWFAIGMKFFAAFLASSGGGVALSAIQSFAEPHRRATAVALVLFLSALLGLGLGPLAVGAASDLFMPTLGAQSLRWALLIPVAALVWAGAHFLAAARTARRDRIA